MRWIYNLPLKRDTPWQVRRHIRTLERDVGRSWQRIYWLCLILGLLAMAIVVICLVHYGIQYGFT